MSENTITGRLALAMCAKHRDESSRRVGELLLAAHPEHFHSLDQALQRVRYYRGQQGGKNRHAAARGGHHPGFRPACPDARMVLPAPVTDPDPWRIVQVDFARCLILADVHIPFHDRAAVEAAVAHGQRCKPDMIILLGNIADFYGQSYFDKDPALRYKTPQHVDTTCAFLEWLRGKFPKAEILYLEGNHEERLWRDAWRSCPEYVGLEALTLRGLLQLDALGIRCIEGRKILRHREHLHLLHGHEVEGRLDISVNTGRGLFRKVLADALCGHTHQSSYHPEKAVDGRLISCWSVGCLCDLHPQYRPLNRWQHGMALLHGGAGWSVENLKIIDGRVV